MAKKAKKNPPKAPLAKNMADYANRIWLAGLAAFARVQRKGDALVDSPVSEGKKKRVKKTSKR